MRINQGTLLKFNWTKEESDEVNRISKSLQDIEKVMIDAISKAHTDRIDIELIR
jgi:hypothetical protein